MPRFLLCAKPKDRSAVAAKIHQKKKKKSNLNMVIYHINISVTVQLSRHLNKKRYSRSFYIIKSLFSNFWENFIHLRIIGGNLYTII